MHHVTESSLLLALFSVYYGWVAMGAAAGVAGHYINAWELSGWRAALAIGASAPLSCTFWLPYQIMKAVSCPPASESKGYLDQQLWCIRHATLSDDLCWLIAIFTSVVMLGCALAVDGASPSAKPPPSRSEGLILWVPRLYFALVVWLYGRYDPDMVPVWLAVSSRSYV